MVMLSLLMACSQDSALKIAEQGSFAVGGTVLTDSSGHTFHGDHAYVFYQIPLHARKYPLVFAHGVGQFSKTWETTPDGRDFKIFSCGGDFPPILSISPVGEVPGVVRKWRQLPLLLMKNCGSIVFV